MVEGAETAAEGGNMLAVLSSFTEPMSLVTLEGRSLPTPMLGLGRPPLGLSSVVEKSLSLNPVACAKFN